MFDFEWTGSSYSHECDRDAGITAAKDFCAAKGYDPEYLANQIATDDEDEEARELWSAIEYEALKAYCTNWDELPENVSLVWN